MFLIFFHLLLSAFIPELQIKYFIGLYLFGYICLVISVIPST